MARRAPRFDLPHSGEGDPLPLAHRQPSCHISLMLIWSRLLTAIAGLMGAAGIGVSAYAAHMDNAPNLVTAAQFLMIHAAAIAALSLTPPRGMVLFATSLLALGAILFCGDLCLRALASRSLFPMAAPLGGMVMIGGWLFIFVSAFTRR